MKPRPNVDYNNYKCECGQVYFCSAKRTKETVEMAKHRTEKHPGRDVTIWSKTGGFMICSFELLPKKQ